MEAGLAGDVDPLIGQCWNDPRRRGVGKARFVGHRDDACLLGPAQGMRWSRTLRVQPAITARHVIIALPASQRADIDAGQSTGWGQPRAFPTGLRDVTDQDLAVCQAGHASSPSWKTAASFFDSTSKAAVSASALSLWCSCRSNSLTRRRSSRASAALAARGSPRPAIASCFQASSSAGYRPCSRHQALRVASSIAAVAITACSRAAAVHRCWPAPPERSPVPLAKPSARQRSSVATLMPTSRDNTSIAALSGGNSRATNRSLYRCPYRATSVFLRPQRFRSYPGGNSCDTGGCFAMILTPGYCDSTNSI